MPVSASRITSAVAELLVAYANINNVCISCICAYSDVFCGSLHCDISQVNDLEHVHYHRSLDGNGTLSYANGDYFATCRVSTFRTFYNGPDRQDPGLVPNGASCGTGKVTLSEKYKISSLKNSISFLAVL